VTDPRSAASRLASAGTAARRTSASLSPLHHKGLAVYYTPAEVYGVAAGTPVALWAPSVPTASTHGDMSTLQTPSFCLENG